MPRTRPLSELPVAVKNMAAAAKLMPPGVVPVLAKNVHAEVERQGRSFVLRGRRGRPVPLTGSVKFQGKTIAAVSGKPIGFWHIVEGGSGPHLITTLGLRTGRRGRFVRASVLRAFEEGGPTGGKPLKIPGIGFRQYATHPGHGPIGQPWRKAMANGDNIVARSLHEHADKAFTKGWLK